jgi:small conductance mechanosensitive channel
VEQLSIRSIKLRAVDGSLHIIPFSTVMSVTNQTRDLASAVIVVNVDYLEDTYQLSEALREIATEMRQDPRWRLVIRDDLDVMGVDHLGDSGVVIRVRLKTEPLQRWAVTREKN